MRLARNEGLPCNTCSYVWLCRTLAAAPGSGGVCCAETWPPRASTSAAARPHEICLGIITPSIIRYECGSWRHVEVCSIHHGQSTADAQHLAGNVIRSPAQEKQDCLCDFDRLRDAAEWNGAGEGFLHTVGLALEQRRVGRAWTDAIDVDLIAGELARERLGKGDQPT